MNDALFSCQIQDKVGTVHKKLTWRQFREIFGDAEAALFEFEQFWEPLAVQRIKPIGGSSRPIYFSFKTFCNFSNTSASSSFSGLTCSRFFKIRPASSIETAPPFCPKVCSRASCRRCCRR